MVEINKSRKVNQGHSRMLLFYLSLILSLQFLFYLGDEHVRNAVNHSPQNAQHMEMIEFHHRSRLVQKRSRAPADAGFYRYIKCLIYIKKNKQKKKKTHTTFSLTFQNS